jgi:hypothetical protein
MQNNEQPLIDADQQRLESSQTGSTWFYLRHPKITVFWLVALIGCAAFVAFKH